MSSNKENASPLTFAMKDGRVIDINDLPLNIPPKIIMLSMCERIQELETGDSFLREKFKAVISELQDQIAEKDAIIEVKDAEIKLLKSQLQKSMSETTKLKGALNAITMNFGTSDDILEDPYISTQNIIMSPTNSISSSTSRTSSPVSSISSPQRLLAPSSLPQPRRRTAIPQPASLSKSMSEYSSSTLSTPLSPLRKSQTEASPDIPRMSKSTMSTGSGKRRQTITDIRPEIPRPTYASSTESSKRKQNTLDPHVMPMPSTSTESRRRQLAVDAQLNISKMPVPSTSTESSKRKQNVPEVTPDAPKPVPSTSTESNKQRQQPFIPVVSLSTTPTRRLHGFASSPNLKAAFAAGRDAIPNPNRRIIDTPGTSSLLKLSISSETDRDHTQAANEEEPSSPRKPTVSTSYQRMMTQSFLANLSKKVADYRFLDDMELPGFKITEKNLTLEDFEAIFNNIGKLIQPTPTRNPTSRIYIRTLAPDNGIEDIFGDAAHHSKTLIGDIYASKTSNQRIGQVYLAIKYLRVEYGSKSQVLTLEFECSSVRTVMF